jgi:hypothetical protein
MGRNQAIGAMMADSPRMKKALFIPVVQRHEGDCGIAALAMFLNTTYEAVLVVASRIVPRVLKKGLFGTQMQLIAEEFGRTVRVKPKVDLDADIGVLFIQYPDNTEHAVYLINGLVFEPTGGRVWDADTYIKSFRIKTTSLLTEV